jgi:predicted lipoprotein with Yx(FWY)xxD motif
MKRLFSYVPAAIAVVVLAGCGSSGSSGSSDTASGTGTDTVAVKDVDGVGDVLADSSGRTLYTPDEEANGKVLCTGACTSFWIPVAADGTPSAAPGVAHLGVIERPDGTKQVTVDGKPLYTFTQDSPGQAKGNGFSDEFGSQHFTWHALMANGAMAGSTPGNSTTPGAGTDSDSGSGYGY